MCAVTTLFDEVVDLGFDRSYPSFTRLIRARRLRPACEPCRPAKGRPVAVIEHPPGDETQWDWVELPDPPDDWGWGSRAFLLVGALAHSSRWRAVLAPLRMADRRHRATPDRLPPGHRLAGSERVKIDEVLDEPFLALPHSSGRLRDYWLAAEARGGHPVTVGAEIANTEESVEALAAGLGVCLLAAGNAPLITRDGITTALITGVAPSELVLLWRHNDSRPLLGQLTVAVQQATAFTPTVSCAR
jgi:LysR substrate binding domain